MSAPGPQTVQKALGETVKLGCIYTPGRQDTGELDIEWSNLNPDMTQRDQLVGTIEGTPGSILTRGVGGCIGQSLIEVEYIRVLSLFWGVEQLKVS